MISINGVLTAVKAGLSTVSIGSMVFGWLRTSKEKRLEEILAALDPPLLYLLRQIELAGKARPPHHFIWVLPTYFNPKQTSIQAPVPGKEKMDSEYSGWLTAIRHASLYLASLGLIQGEASGAEILISSLGSDIIRFPQSKSKHPDAFPPNAKP